MSSEIVRNGDGRPSLPDTFVSGLHKGIEFEGKLCWNGRFTGLKKLYDFPEHRSVISPGFLFNDGFRAKGGHLEGGFSIANPVQGPNALVVPFSGHHNGPAAFRGHDALTPGPHHREERFCGMNTIPEEAGMVRF